MNRERREVTVLGEGFSFLEGPRWHGDRLYVSDFYTHRVLAFDEAGRYQTVCEVPGRPSGLGFARDGSLLVVSMVDRRLMKLVDGELVEVADLSHLATWHCNDMLVDAQGRAYIGNFGWDADSEPPVVPSNLIRVDPDGRAHVAATGLVFPNGVVLTPDGRTLIVAETFASRIAAFDVDEDGSLSNRRVWAVFGEPGDTVPATVASGLPLPDGMALDAEGALWIGDAAGPGALRVAEGGEILEVVGTGDLSVYAVALGGSDRRTLFMCASPPLLQTNPAVDHRAILLSFRVDVAGAGLP
jgi:sugar lactone lactonase YvrE